ncbi:MAG: hypothetical protein HC844_03815 [Tabrizicola sp.]|nr:hypothetical protein [Tabrizicola sp.]
MNGEILNEKLDGRDEEDYDHRSTIGLPQSIGAPTTQKRVGRSMRQSPGPSVCEGPGESTVSTEDSPEDLGTNLIENIRDLLKTRKGMDDLREGLDDTPAEERSAQELDRLERTISQLQREGTFAVPVFSVPRERPSRLKFPDGRVREVTLGARQRTIWIGGGTMRAIVVAAHMPPDTRVDEIACLLADEVETVARENRVAVRPGGVLAFFRAAIASGFFGRSG